MGKAESYSPYTWEAAQALGLLVSAARRERRWTAASLAERAGVSLTTLRKVERGDPTVALGTAFELAALTGVRLFDADRAEMPDRLDRFRDRAALLPSRVRDADESVFDEF